MTLIIVELDASGRRVETPHDAAQCSANIVQFLLRQPSPQSAIDTRAQTDIIPRGELAGGPRRVLLLKCFKSPAPTGGASEFRELGVPGLAVTAGSRSDSLSTDDPRGARLR